MADRGQSEEGIIDREMEGPPETGVWLRRISN